MGEEINDERSQYMISTSFLPQKLTDTSIDSENEQEFEVIAYHKGLDSKLLNSLRKEGINKRLTNH